MQRVQEKLILSPTDLVGFLACAHLTMLDLAVARGDLRSPVVDNADNADNAVVRERGLEHETAYLKSLHDEGLSIVEIPDHEGGNTVETLVARSGSTRTALRSGVDIVFQATFFEPDSERENVLWRGHADFLRRVSAESGLGDYSYEPEDTKLARHVKPSAVLQLCAYAEQLAVMQGRVPDRVHVVLGGGIGRESLRLKDVAAYYRTTRGRFLARLLDARQPETYPLAVGHCVLCRWDESCTDKRTADDHLSQVANLSTLQARKLEGAGVATMRALAGANDDLRVHRIGTRTLDRLRRQASLQVARQPDEAPPHEFIFDNGPSQGFGLLPEPSDGDIFYDIEGDPYVGQDGIEYLHGVSWVEKGSLQFLPIWSHDEAEEKAGFEQLMDLFAARRHEFPNMHIYHYAPYETSALKRLMGRYGTRENELDALLRDEVLVDLYRVVRQAMVIGSPSYSLKKLEPLYMPKRDGAIVDAGSSIVEYERWLETSEQSILDNIEEYNRVDVESTFLLRSWLEERRAEAIAAGIACERPLPPKPYEPPPAKVDLDTTDGAITAALLALETPEGHLMASLLHWHEREDKPEWWSYFSRLEMDDDELFDDGECIVGLEQHGDPTPDKKSLVWTYSFDPEQECKLTKGARVVDPVSARHNIRTEDKAERIPNDAFELTTLDTGRGLLSFRRGASSMAPPPFAVVANGPLDNRNQRKSIQFLADLVTQIGIDDEGPARGGRQLLGRRLPLATNHEANAALLIENETPVDAVLRVGGSLDGSYLAVQGPPGAGKTYAAARLIASLVKQRKPVGIVANGHAVITNVLREALDVIARAGEPAPLVLQKGPSDDSWTPTAGVTSADNDAIEAAAHSEVLEDRPAIIAGTAWLWSREGMRDAVDTLVVDEAGQFSLANALAVSGATRNLVLLGDPQQLAQPSKGVHPTGAGLSALEHVLGEHNTVSAEAGVFLDTTYRMHPSVTEFISEQVYEDRLESADKCGRQSVGGDGNLSGTGLRFRPVMHEGNANHSPEEVDEVVRTFEDVVGREWTNGDDIVAPIGVADVLVVAPYNVQVNALIAALPEGARVGTVDKFQGQEAAVVIVSMTASSAANIPRGMEFLYSRNRLNVAVSRAKAMCVLVASPELLAVECRTVEQMRLANVLCRYVEMAQ